MSGPLADWGMDFGEPNPVVVPKTYTEADLREANAQAWDEGYDKGTDLAAWAIGNRPNIERPNTVNPYRAEPTP